MKKQQLLKKEYEDNEANNAWSVRKIIDFNQRLGNLSQDEFDEIEGFNDYGYGEWITETKSCDSWGGGDVVIEEFFGANISELADAEDIDFLHELDDELVIFSQSRFKSALADSGYMVNRDFTKIQLIKD